MLMGRNIRERLKWILALMIALAALSCQIAYGQVAKPAQKFQATEKAPSWTLESPTGLKLVVLLVVDQMRAD